MGSTLKRIGIIGGGSVGLLLAFYLRKCHYDVTIYTRTKQQATLLTNNGVSLLETNTVKATYSVKSIALTDIKSLSDDFLFIAVKEYHLKNIIPYLLTLKGKVHTMIFLQNGMGHVPYLEKLGSKVENILVGIVEHGALKRSSTAVSHTGVGELKIGHYLNRNSQADDVWKHLSKQGFATVVYPNWLSIMEKKLVVNGVINPLTAILNVRNGTLVTNPFYFQLMRKLFEEISLCFHCNEGDWKRVVEICKQTSENRSSMLKDLDEGRETEIEAITGIILEKGKAMGQPLPLNEWVYLAIKGMDLQKGGKNSE